MTQQILHTSQLVMSFARYCELHFVALGCERFNFWGSWRRTGSRGGRDRNGIRHALVGGRRMAHRNRNRNLWTWNRSRRRHFSHDGWHIRLRTDARNEHSMLRARALPINRDRTDRVRTIVVMSCVTYTIVDLDLRIRLVERDREL